MEMEYLYPTGGIVIAPFANDKEQVVHLLTQNRGIDKIDKEIIDKICVTNSPEMIGLTHYHDVNDNVQYSLYFGDFKSVLIPRQDGDLLSHRADQRERGKYRYIKGLNISHHEDDICVYPLINVDAPSIWCNCGQYPNTPIKGMAMFGSDLRTLRIDNLNLFRGHKIISARHTLMISCITSKIDESIHHTSTFMAVN